MRRKFKLKENNSLILFLLAVVFVLLFLKLADTVVWDRHLDVLDQSLANAVYTLRSPAMTEVMTVITNFGSAGYVAAVSIVVGLALFLKHKLRYMVPFVLSLAGAGVFAEIFKTIFARMRPSPTSALISETGFSFPSGHSLIAICLYGVLIYFLIRIIKPRWAKLAVGVIGIGLILAIGFSRVYLGVHWPTDVLASYLLGSGWLCFLAAIFEYRWHKL